MSKRVYLTTFDNPNDPSKDFKAWFNWDIAHQYNTSQLVALAANTSEYLSDESNVEATERAIDDIIRLLGKDFYKKIVVNSEESDFIPEESNEST